MRHRRYALLILLALVFSQAACPSSSDLDRMAKASRELAHDVKLANQVVGELYKAGKIPLEKKDAIADKLGRIGVKGNAFNEELIKLDQKYPQGTLPPDALTLLKANFTDIKNLFTEVFGDLLPLGAQSAVKRLGNDIATIDKVVSK